jgi:hypothetical protein
VVRFNKVVWHAVEIHFSLTHSNGLWCDVLTPKNGNLWNMFVSFGLRKRKITVADRSHCSTMPLAITRTLCLLSLLFGRVYLSTAFSSRTSVSSKMGRPLSPLYSSASSATICPLLDAPANPEVTLEVAMG